MYSCFFIIHFIHWLILFSVSFFILFYFASFITFIYSISSTRKSCSWWAHTYMQANLKPNNYLMKHRTNQRHAAWKQLWMSDLKNVRTDFVNKNMTEKSRNNLVQFKLSCCHRITNPSDFLITLRQIKRPYFHVRPLDRLQLRAWHTYLDWEIAELNKDTKESSQGEDTHHKSVFMFESICIQHCCLQQIQTRNRRRNLRSQRSARKHQMMLPPSRATTEFASCLSAAWSPALCTRSSGPGWDKSLFHFICEELVTM